MEYLLGLIALLVGWALVGRFKTQQAEDKLAAMEVQNKLSDALAKLGVNEALLKAEEDLRKAEIGKKSNATPEENADYFNGSKPTD